MKTYVEHATHTFNRNGNVEVKCLVEDKEIYLELTEKDVRSMQQWFTLSNQMQLRRSKEGS